MIVYKNWSEIPGAWKNLKKVSKLIFDVNPYDKNFVSLVNPFFANKLDAMFSNPEASKTLVYLAAKNNIIAAINGYSFVVFPNKNNTPNGLYPVGSFAKKLVENQIADQSTPVFEDEKFPDVSKLTGDYNTNPDFKYQVSFYKLLQYVKVAQNFGIYSTFKTSGKHTGMDKISLNNEYLQDICIFYLKQGIDKGYIYKNGNIVLFLPDESYEIGKTIIAGLAKISPKEEILGSIKENNLNGTIESKLACYFDFTKNEIVNENGSLVDFELSYNENEDLAFLNPEMLDLINKLKERGQDAILYFTPENVFAGNNEMQFLTSNLSKQKVTGLFRLNNNAIIPTNQTDISSWNEAINLTKKSIDSKTIVELNVQKSALKYFTSILLDYVGDDDFRPIMKGICFEFTDKINMISTDSHSLGYFDITKFVDLIFKEPQKKLSKSELKHQPFYEYEDKYQFTVDLKMLSDFLETTDSETATMKFNEDSLIIQTEESIFVIDYINGKFPNYKAVVPTYFKRKISWTNKNILSCLKSKEILEAIKTNKSKYNLKAIIINNDKSYFVIYNDYETLAKIELCENDFKIEEIDYSHSYENAAMLMPVLTSKILNNVPQDEELGLNYDLFVEIIENLSSNENSFYTEELGKRACLFPYEKIALAAKKAINKKTETKAPEPKMQMEFQLVPFSEVPLSSQLQKLIGQPYTDDFKRVDNYYEYLPTGQKFYVSSEKNENETIPLADIVGKGLDPQISVKAIDKKHTTNPIFFSQSNLDNITLDAKLSIKGIEPDQSKKDYLAAIQKSIDLGFKWTYKIAGKYAGIYVLIKNYNHIYNTGDVLTQKGFETILKSIQVDTQFEKGKVVEEEHRDTLEQVSKGKITVDEAIEKTVEDHLKENPEYYTELEKIPLVKSIKKYKSSTKSDAFDFVRNVQTHSYVVTFEDGKTEYVNATDKEEAKKLAIQELVEYSKKQKSKQTEPKKSTNYDSMSLEELRSLKEKLYPNPDIESPMSEDEKLLTKKIAEKFSELNKLVSDKKELKNGIVALKLTLEYVDSESEKRSIEEAIEALKTTLEIFKLKILA